MDLLIALVVGLASGFLNVVAGGGTLIVFPTLENSYVFQFSNFSNSHKKRLARDCSTKLKKTKFFRLLFFIYYFKVNF